MTGKPKNQARGNPETRQLLLATAEALMREEGYAAVTTRRLGERAGVKSTLVYYYFKDMDDLFVSLYRHRAERHLAQARSALAEGDVPHRLWQQANDPSEVALNLEFMALGNHRKSVRAVAVEYGEVLRSIQLEALQRYLARSGDRPQLQPDGLITLLSAVGLLCVLEGEAGMNFGHAEVRRHIESMLDRQSDPAPSEQPATTKRRSRTTAGKR